MPLSNGLHRDDLHRNASCPLCPHQSIKREHNRCETTLLPSAEGLFFAKLKPPSAPDIMPLQFVHMHMETSVLRFLLCHALIIIGGSNVQTLLRILTF